MNISHWKIFDKKGSTMNWTPDPYILLEFTSTFGVDVKGYLLSDPSGYISGAEIINGGFYYTPSDTVSYTYLLGDNGTFTSVDVSLKDVSIFNPEPSTTQSISGLYNITLDASGFIYPSTTFASAIFLEPVSQGLVETEHLFILEETLLGDYIRPYDASNSTLVFRMIGDDSQIAFFNVNETTTEITWTDELIFDVSLYVEGVPLSINIGFRSDEEGVFERTIRIYHLIGDQLYTMADIVVNAEAIGEDERFRTLLSNFGSPDPKDFPKIFKEIDINEDLPDWQVLNAKSKHMILEHDQIMPYVGTYKALINALKWLGYDDIYVREWFKDVKENKKISFIVPFDAKDRTQTILMFDLDRRKTLKKLNQLTLVYCLTRETGEIDVWGTPLTENCYSYNIREVFIKLLALKQWLERYIIGINCRITDITGEGIYFERVQNLIYETDNIGYGYEVEHSLSPYSPDHDSELIRGDASIRLTFLELTNGTVGNMLFRFVDTVSYAWTPYDPLKYYALDDPSYLADPSHFVLIGPNFQYPLVNFSDVMWKLSVEKTDAGTIEENLVTNPLFIYENDIRYYNIFDTSSVFHDVSTHLTILLEKAFLRDPSIDEWEHAISYSIYPDPCDNGSYTMESSTGTITKFDGYVMFRPDTSSRLQYAVDTNFRVPLLTMLNYKYTDDYGVTGNFAGKDYILDIVDGKIAMNAGYYTSTSDNVTFYINWNYDTSLDEQKITVNVVYQSPRLRLFQTDPSTYYWADPSGLTGGNDPNVMSFDNSIYTMHVHHTGDYVIELYAWDEYNTMFYNDAKKLYPVWTKRPTVHILVDNPRLLGYEVSTYMTALEVYYLTLDNLRPIYDRYIPLQDLSVEKDANGNVYISVPSITYFQDVPEPNSINRFFNMTERVVYINHASSTNDIIAIDQDYQVFTAGDTVRIINFNLGEYDIIQEVSAFANGSYDNPDGTRSLAIDIVLPPNFVINASSCIYVLNDTYRTTYNIINDSSSHLSLEVKDYQFEVGQIVGIIVQSSYMPGYEWGASYKVISVDGSIHTFDNKLPEFLLDSSIYTIQAKHAFSSYTDFNTKTLSATEVATDQGNTFQIYLKDSYCHEYYIDNTLVFMNILFDHDIINYLWYDPSSDAISPKFYYYPRYINIDTSTFVILRADYDSSDYMLNQKNIWTVRWHDTNEVYFRVFNYSVPFVFYPSGHYILESESYDKHGNLIKSE